MKEVDTVTTVREAIALQLDAGSKDFSPLYNNAQALVRQTLGSVTVESLRDEAKESKETFELLYDLAGCLPAANYSGKFTVEETNQIPLYKGTYLQSTPEWRDDYSPKPEWFTGVPIVPIGYRIVQPDQRNRKPIGQVLFCNVPTDYRSNPSDRTNPNDIRNILRDPTRVRQSFGVAEVPHFRFQGLKQHMTQTLLTAPTEEERRANFDIKSGKFKGNFVTPLDWKWTLYDHDIPKFRGDPDDPLDISKYFKKYGSACPFHWLGSFEYGIPREVIDNYNVIHHLSVLAARFGVTDAMKRVALNEADTAEPKALPYPDGAPIPLF